MKTEELITILSQGQPVKKPIVDLKILSILLVLVCFLLTRIVLGLRPELQSLQLPYSFWFKTCLLAGAALFGVRMLLVSSVPVSKFGVQYYGYFLAVCAGCALIYEWATKPFDQIKQIFLMPNFGDCLFFVSIFGAGASLVMLLFVSRLAAPLNLRRTAGFIGLAAAGISGFGYSFHCPIDSPTFIVTAYGLPQLCLFFVCRKFYAHFLKW